MKHKDYIRLGLVGAMTITALCVGCSTSDSLGSEMAEPNSCVLVTEGDLAEYMEATATVQTAPQTDGTDIGGEDTEQTVTEPIQGEEGANEEDVSTLLSVSVVRVVDGDTYIVDMDGEEARVRLIGVDTPESVAPQSYTEKTGKENTEVGGYISEIMKEVIEQGDTLYLEFDVDMYDKYDRVLAYAYFDDGEMVQDFLLSNGLAQTMTITPNVKYSDHFSEVQRVAMENGIGIWNYDIETITKEDLMPSTRTEKPRVTDCGWNKD